MKNVANRLKVKKLFIFGAGTTFSLSKRTRKAFKQSPLDTDFCKKMLSLDIKKPGWVKGSVDYIKRYWRDSTEMQKLGLEQAIIIQLSHLEFIQAIAKRRNRSILTKEEYLSHFTHLICYVLSRVRVNDANLLTRFVDKFFKSNTKNRIVTFNYDTVIDLALNTRFNWQKIYFNTIKDSKTLTRTSSFKHPLLIKLHGSMNWRCSEDDFNKILVRSEDVEKIGDIWIDNRNRPSPDDEKYPLIIPPLPNKPITSISLFNYLWTKAYEYLHEAEELIIAGYSLPETDTLANVMFRGFKNKKIKKITIIDPNALSLEKWKTLLRRKNVAEAELVYYEDFANYLVKNC